MQEGDLGGHQQCQVCARCPADIVQVNLPWHACNRNITSKFLLPLAAALLGVLAACASVMPACDEPVNCTAGWRSQKT